MLKLLSKLLATDRPTSELYLDGVCVLAVAVVFLAFWHATAALSWALPAALTGLVAVGYIGSALKKSLGF